MNSSPNKKIGRTVYFLALTALLFSLSITVFASKSDEQKAQKGLAYQSSAASTLASSAADEPVAPVEIPDFLLPKNGGYILPNEGELSQYLPPRTSTPPTEEAKGPPPTIVPESEPVGDDYFADAVFIGDSRTVGMMTYSGVKSHFYAKVSLNIFSVLHTRFLVPPEGGDNLLTVLEALEKYPVFSKVYICFGVNELGYNPTSFINAYEYFLDQVMQRLPNATIYIQSIIPVTKEAAAKSKYGVTNEAIVRNNALLLDLAKKKGVYYVNVYEIFAGEDGALDPSLSSDGIHLGKEGIKMQMDYLRAHTVGANAAKTSSNTAD